MLDISLENNIYIMTPVEQFFQEVDVLFNTKLTSLIGEPLFGTDFEQFLWSLKDNTEEISDYVNKCIKSNCPSADNVIWSAGCRLIYDDLERSYYYILIAVMVGQDDIQTKSYIFHNYSEDIPNI